jgi:hypothetical protein
MKKNLLIALAFFSAGFVSAQKLEENQSYGKVTLKDGTVLDGVVEVDYEPYRTQNSIRFFDKKLLENGQPKNKEKQKFAPADVKEVRTDKSFYVVKRYADMQTLSINTAGRPYFLEVVKPGKLALFNYYAEIGVKPDLLIGKDGEEKTKAVGSTALKGFIEDCPTVKEKFEKGEYGNDPKDDTALMNNNLKFINQLVDDYNAACGSK